MASKKTIAERKEEIRKRRAVLDAQFQALSAKENQEERKKENRRKIIAGSVLLTAALNDAGFAAAVRLKLKNGLTKDADRDLFKDFLAGTSKESHAANQSTPSPAPPVPESENEPIKINE